MKQAMSISFFVLGFVLSFAVGVSYAAQCWDARYIPFASPVTSLEVGERVAVHYSSATGPVYSLEITGPPTKSTGGCGTSQNPAMTALSGGFVVSYVPERCSDLPDGTPTYRRDLYKWPQVSYTCPPEPPPEPETCSNYILDPGEFGVDCGGDCLSICVQRCPDGWPPSEGSTWFPDGKCMNGLVPSNSIGECPEGTVKNLVGGCIGVADPVYIASDSTPEEITEIFLNNPPSEPNSFAPTSDTMTESTSSSVVDNGDGTSTKTTITTKNSTNNDYSITETTTTIINNVTGDVISEDKETVLQNDPDDNPANYSLDSLADNEYIADFLDLLPDELSITDLVGGFIQEHPVTDALSTLTLNLTSPESVVTIPEPIYGQTINFDFQKYETYMRMAGVLLVVAVTIWAVMFVFSFRQK